jgi:hypothetical protein
LEQQHLPKLVNEAEQGEQYILKNIIEVHKGDKQEAFGVQNI